MDSTGISFTALYTGQVWVEHGLANREFSSTKGKLLYRCSRPADYLFDRVYGFNLRKALLQRHLIIDHLLDQMIEKYPDIQVLEIACGLSSRGVRTLQKSADIDYIEADLPLMAQKKRNFLSKLDCQKRPVVMDCDIFSNGELGLDSLFDRALDRSRPLVVITEGLVNYFELEMISGFWVQLNRLFQGFPAASYLTDLFPNTLLQDSPAPTRSLLKLLGKVTRSKVNLHFDSENELLAHFSDCGHSNTKIHRPEAYTKRLNLPVTKVDSPLFVVQAGI